MDTLLSILNRSNDDDDLATRIAWIQDLIAGVEAAEGLRDVRDAVTLDLRASLGAVVAWSRGPRDDDSTAALVALLTVLGRRAMATVHRALARKWQLLTADIEEAAAIAAVFADVADTIEQGLPVSPAARAQLEALRRRTSTA